MISANLLPFGFTESNGYDVYRNIEVHSRCVRGCTIRIANSEYQDSYNKNAARGEETSWCEENREKLVENSVLRHETLQSLVNVKSEIAFVVAKYNQEKPRAEQVVYPNLEEWDIVVAKAEKNLSGECVVDVSHHYQRIIQAR